MTQAIEYQLAQSIGSRIANEIMMDVIEQLDHMPVDVNFEIRRKHILDAEAREEAVNPSNRQQRIACPCELLNSCLTPSQTLIFVCRVCRQHLAHKSVEPHSMRSAAP